MTPNPGDLIGGTIWFGGGALLCHAVRDRPGKMWRGAFIIVFTAIFVNLMSDYFYCFAEIVPTPTYLMTTGVIGFGMMLFVLLCETMMLGFARMLTRWLGEVWVERLTYVNIGLGAISVMFTVGHLKNTEPNPLLPDYYWPFVLTTSLVLAAIQLRIKNGNWHRIP